MSLAPGERFGVYEIVSLVGAGGMGEVYRAHDTKLGRDVAIKVLPDAVAADADRVARLEREAKALAALNHPNIAHLYGLERRNAVDDPRGIFLVMELVDGDTLADRIQRGALRVDDALQIAIQIADALEAAHEKGIVHRDLKPANVKITPDERVKVLDFGLARLGAGSGVGVGQSVAPNATQSPTLSMLATEAGIILGTAAYMSPEQAKGSVADHRSDVFAFGIVLYEMLTGGQPFHGETAADVMASILAREPDLDALPGGLNPRLRELLTRCLEKNPKKRWQAVGDLRMELEAIAASPRALTSGTVVSAGRSRWPAAIPAAAAILASAITALVVSRTRAPWVGNPSPVRFAIPLSDAATMPTGRSSLAISPDGAAVVFARNRQLFLRLLSESESRPIPGSIAAGEAAREVATPTFSPDGRFVAFTSGRAIRRIPVVGGTSTEICDPQGPVFGMSWVGDDIVFGVGNTGSSRIMRVNASGGQPEPMITMKDDEVAYGPQILPGGRVLLLTVATGDDDDRWDRAKIVAYDLESKERKTVVVDDGSDGRYVPTGHLVFARAGVLLAAPFDLRTLALAGPPRAVIEGVRRSNVSNNTGVAHYHFSPTGSLVYMAGSPALGKTLGLLDRKGVVQPLKLSERRYAAPRFSPDGRHLAVTTDDGDQSAIWIYDLAGDAPLRRLTVGRRNRLPIWTADGSRIAFQSADEGDAAIFWQRADGTGTPERLTRPGPGETHVPDSWSPKGDAFLFTVVTESRSSLWTFSVNEHKAARFDDVESARGWPHAVFSPDGRWVAYASGSERDGSFDGEANGLFVQPYPPTGTLYQFGGGEFPIWSRDGKELLFARPSMGGAFNIVGVTTTPAFAVGTPVVVPRGEFVTPRGGGRGPRNWDLAPDGQHLIGVIDASTQGAPQIQAVINWFEELKARVPSK